MPRDAQQAKIAEDLQCFTRKFFQIAVYYIKLLKSSVHAKKTVLFDQSQWRIDELKHSHIQWIQSGPFLDRHALVSQIREGNAETGQIRILTTDSLNSRSDLTAYYPTRVTEISCDFLAIPRRRGD
ncbi:hypothetical protein ALC60_07782 [Trachymyrmex zeteki]|uniref:Uncharacterized protein n=1 Tax=Mycetomoellerius zeteki TaxID=64791 RepID=A0A151WYU5_9HYME|nr:hypothetical protein ALC60_07782 [Trachymyrmex zeteki]